MDGERLSDLRKDRGLTQKELADKLQIHVSSLSLYERNQASPDDSVNVKIAKYFNVSLDYLLGITDYERPLDTYKARLIKYSNLPERAERELNEFLSYLEKKYKLNKL